MIDASAPKLGVEVRSVKRTRPIFDSHHVVRLRRQLFVEWKAGFTGMEWVGRPAIMLNEENRHVRAASALDESGNSPNDGLATMRQQVRIIEHASLNVDDDKCFGHPA